ncbi:MAG TPA: DUF6166 domain-containing protein [Aldersonia sp.]
MSIADPDQVAVSVRTYSGTAGQEGVGGVVIAICDNGEPSGVLRHHMLYSPTGMRWGFRGLGPKDLSRSLLIDAVGESVVCGVCRGGNRVVFDAEADGFVPFDPVTHAGRTHGSCGACRHGYTLTHREETAFETEIVARLGRQWTLSRDQIVQWRRGYLRRAAVR